MGVFWVGPSIFLQLGQDFLVSQTNLGQAQPFGLNRLIWVLNWAFGARPDSSWDLKATSGRAHVTLWSGSALPNSSP